MGETGGHYIVCGMGIIGYRIVELLHRLGERVVVVTLAVHEERIEAARSAGVEVRIADARDQRVLRELGIADARALLVTTAQDVVNVEIALDAKRLRPDLPVVMRLFDQNLARQFESAFQIRRALGMATVAAPRIAAAASGNELIGRFSHGGEELVVAALEAAKRPGIVGVEPARLFGGTARLLTRGRQDRRSHGDGEPIGADERILVLASAMTWDERTEGRSHRVEAPGGVARRWRETFARLHAAWRGASTGLKAVFGVLATLMGVSVAIFRFGMDLSLVDAFYFMVTTLTTTGYGDISVRDQAVWLKVYTSIMMLLGSATIATVYSLITDWIVTARVRQLLGQKPVPTDGHVIVAGLGIVGFRVAEELKASGVAVVIIERDAEGDFVGGIRQELPLVIGDARLHAVLEQAQVRGAKCVLAVTSDDAVNLSICLSAKEMNPGIRTVVRVFDIEFARKVEESPLIDVALGASRIAAPKFVASALFTGVLKAFLDGDTMCVLLAGGPDLELRPEDRPQVVWKAGAPAYEGDPRESGRIVQVFRPFTRPWETGGIVD